MVHDDMPHRRSSVFLRMAERGLLLSSVPEHHPIFRRRNRRLDPLMKVAVIYHIGTMDESQTYNNRRISYMLHFAKG